MTGSFKLVRPDGSSQQLESTPLCREDAMDVVRRARQGFGRHSFVRGLLDPDCGDVDLAEITVSVYPGGELGIVELVSTSEINVVPRDIVLYLEDAVGSSREAVARLSLDVYEDPSVFERDNVWLSLEDAAGVRVAEFALEARDRLVLPDKPESSSDAIYVCGLPTFRSVFRFVSIACEVFQCEDVRVRPVSLSSESVDWFS